MGKPQKDLTSRLARRRRVVVALGAVALAVVAAGPAGATGFGERLTEWPVASAVGAALIFAALAIVFGLLARASRYEDYVHEVTEPNGPSAEPEVEADALQDEAAEAATQGRAKNTAKGKAKVKRPVSGDADPLYTPATCQEFAQGLSDDVLRRAQRLFQPLGQVGRIDSAQLAEILGTSPASLGGLLTTPLSRRADAMGLPLPYVIDRIPGSRRRVWRDHAGIAGRVALAIRDELEARGSGAIALPAALDEVSEDGHETVSPGREIAIRSGVSPY